MRSINIHQMASQTIRLPLTSLFTSKSSRSFTVTCHARANSTRPLSTTTTTTTGTSNFTWDEVFRISKPDYLSDDPSNLNGFFDKIKLCNRGSQNRSEFFPFVVDDRIVGYIHNRFASLLRRFDDVFVHCENNRVTLNSKMKTAEERTKFIGEVISCLCEEGVIPGRRNELYPVSSSYGDPVFFSLERAAAPYFGIKAYGVHMNGYVENDGQKLLWIGKRSQDKPTYPGMLDHLVAGGLPHGIACGENLIKECEEEAGIPRSLSSGAVPVGAVSYRDIDGYRYKRDVLFCYDLKLPKDFVPKNEDGEVEGFQLIPVTEVANIIRRTHFFKPNCSLVIIDFLFRHGYICPEYAGYLDLLQSLKSGDCS